MSSVSHQRDSAASIVPRSLSWDPILQFDSFDIGILRNAHHALFERLGPSLSKAFHQDHPFWSIRRHLNRLLLALEASSEGITQYDLAFVRVLLPLGPCIVRRCVKERVVHERT